VLAFSFNQPNSTRREDRIAFELIKTLDADTSRPTRSATHDRCKRSPIRRLGTEDWRIDSEDWRLSAGDRRAKTAAEDEDEDEDGEEDQDEAVIQI